MSKKEKRVRVIRFYNSDNVCRLARRFVRRKLKRKASFKTLSCYAAEMGYVIIFYTPDEPNDIIDKHGFREKLLTKPALAVRRKSEKYIFINSTCSTEHKMMFLAHELAHIILGHLDMDKNIFDKEACEIEADAFTYEVLRNKRWRGR